MSSGKADCSQRRASNASSWRSAATIFRLRRDGSRVVAERSEVVRGIVLKSESVAIDAWLTALSEALSTHAGTSAQALDALRRIGGRSSRAGGVAFEDGEHDPAPTSRDASTSRH